MAKVSKIKDAVPYSFYTSNMMVDLLAEDMFYKFFKEARSDAVRERVKTGFRAFTGFDMLTDNVSKERSAPYALNGIAGNGKTTVIEAASAIVAKHLHMNLLTTRDVVRKISADPGWQPSEQDMILHTKSMGGMMSAQDLYGTPCFSDKVMKDGTTEARVRNIPEEVVAVMRHAGCAVLILDDFWNCSEMVQNAALQVIDRGQLDTTDLGNCFIPITGNLGAVDGSYVNAPSTPMATRLKMVYVEDTPEDWCCRVGQEFNDVMGDSYVSAFIRAVGESGNTFNIPASDERLNAYEIRPTTANPRTWHSLVTEMRRYLHRCKCQGQGPSVSKIESIAGMCVGPIAGKEYASFANQMLSGVDLVARDLMDTGVLDRDKFSKLFGNGISAAERDKSHQFAASFANHAARKAIEGAGKLDALKEAMTRYTRGMLALDPSTMQLSVNYLVERLSNVEGLSEVRARKSGFTGSGMATRVLTQAVRENIVATMMTEGKRLGLWSPEIQETINGNLAGSAKWQPAPRSVAARAGVAAR